VFAAFDMGLWIGALSGAWSIGGAAGPIAWHAHEMLFGYGAAALCGFVLTAVPNWTGRLPVSGMPLLGLVVVWLVGRLAMLSPGTMGEIASAIADAIFLPTLAFVVAREVVVGRNWPNLRIALGISTLAGLNIWFHIASLNGSNTSIVLRATVALFVLLVTHIGGRIVPSFTRNFLARRNLLNMPRTAGALDRAALGLTLAAGTIWTVAPQSWATTVLALSAAVANCVRLGGWHGQHTLDEPLLAFMHVAYAFVGLGWFAVAASAMGWISEASAFHVFTVGAIGMMTLAVMTRASRGHTGRPLTASLMTTLSYFALFAVAVLRPLAEFAPAHYHEILALSAIAWIGAFALFVVEHAPMLLGPSLTKQRAR
jgi:uncharacterized protein involved in response to NO